MTPSPYLQLLKTSTCKLDVAGAPAAAFVMRGLLDAVSRWQVQADEAGLALVIPSADQFEGCDGMWTQDAAQIGPLRTAFPGAQLVAVVQEIDEAMRAAEAGADLILFGGFEPIPISGSYEKAADWALISEIPCGCLINEPPAAAAFGSEGLPEFFLNYAA